MKFLVVFTIAILALYYTPAEGGKCKTPVHYKEVGCTPITKPGDECPSSYNCDNLKELADPIKCHYRGKVYSEREGPERPEIPPCVPYALCYQGNFMAGHIDCGPLFRKPDEECIDVKQGCCRRTICGKEEIDKIPVCYLQGQKFFEGEKIDTKEDPCVQCTCDDKFDNSTSIYENKNCKINDCFSDFWHLNDFIKGCAPVYYGKDRCCASHTKCPSETEDKLIKATEAPADSSLKCKFGVLELQIGDRVNDKNNCLDCTCLTPPLVECHSRENCERIFN